MTHADCGAAATATAAEPERMTTIRTEAVALMAGDGRDVSRGQEEAQFCFEGRRISRERASFKEKREGETRGES